MVPPSRARRSTKGSTKSPRQNTRSERRTRQITQASQPQTHLAAVQATAVERLQSTLTHDPSSDERRRTVDVAIEARRTQRLKNHGLQRTGSGEHSTEGLEDAGTTDRGRRHERARTNAVREGDDLTTQDRESSGNSSRTSDTHSKPRAAQEEEGERTGQRRAPRRKTGGPQKKEAQTPNTQSFSHRQRLTHRKTGVVPFRKESWQEVTCRYLLELFLLGKNPQYPPPRILHQWPNRQQHRS